jgi:hypothetical protein
MRSLDSLSRSGANILTRDVMAFDPASEGIAEWDVEHATRSAAHCIDAPVADLVARRRDVNYFTLKWLLENPKWGAICVIGCRGRFYIVDGHHRSCVATLRGDATIRARVFYK